MPELSLAALQPAAAPPARRAPSAASSPGDREPAREPAAREVPERPQRRETDDRRATQREDEPRENAAKERDREARQPSGETRTERAEAPDGTATPAEETRTGDEERPFAALLAAQMTPAVPEPTALPRTEIAAGVHAAVRATPASELLPGGKSLPPPALSGALERHAAVTGRAAGEAAATLPADGKIGGATPPALTEGEATVDPELLAAGRKPAAETLRSGLPEPLPAQAARTGEGAADPLSPLQNLAARATGEAAGGTQPARAMVTVEAPVGTARWNQAFGERVSWLVREGSQVASMRLDPPQLGPVDVRVSVSNGEASLSFVAQHGNVRDAIQDALPRLREMLGEQGLSLGNVDVSGRDPRGDGSAERTGGDATGGNGRNGEAFADDEEGGDLLPGPAVRVREGLLDHFV